MNFVCQTVDWMLERTVGTETNRVGQVHEKLDIHGKKLSRLHSYLITIFR